MGIVITIVVLVQALIVTGTLFSVTKPPFWEFPKPDPLIST